MHIRTKTCKMCNMATWSSFSLPLTFSSVSSVVFVAAVVVTRVLLCVPLYGVRAKSVGNLGLQGEVTDTFKCTFDTDLCGMEQDFTDNFDWLRHSGQTTTFNTGPLCDPLLCSTGYYIYTESSRPRAAGEVTRISTPLLHGDGGRCLLFYWHMEGESVGSLRVWLRTLEGREVNIWSQTGNQTGGWHHEALDYVPSDFDNTTRFYKLVFEGTIGQSGTISFRGDIAIDNIEVLVGECSEVVRNDCTFQQDMCSWQNEPYPPGTLGRRDWVRTSGSTLTPSTGPTGTHNNMVNDYYMYVESSRTFRNDTARLISGRISGQVLGYCLQFFSHMFGPDIGTLSVLTQMESTRLLRQAWSLSGNHGDRWIRQAVYISSPGQEFRVIFQAVLTGGGLGDIAIDDITIHGGQCDTQ